MREIFVRRGKRVDNGEWVYGNIVFTRSGRAFLLEGSFFSGESHEGNFKHGEIYGTEVIPETAGEYTGLKDKNGKRIFEGGIIQSVETGEIGIVQWFPEHSAFMVWCRSSNEIGFLYECSSIVEVIGNVHDNPGLLKGE